MAKSVDIIINQDERCSKCGTKGATQSGLCLDCINRCISRIPSKGGFMGRISEEVTIDKLEAKVKMVEDKEDGMVVDRHLVTQATIQYEGTPAKLERVLWALQSGHLIHVTFTTPQLELDMQEEEQEPAMAGK